MGGGWVPRDVRPCEECWKKRGEAVAPAAEGAEEWQPADDDLVDCHIRQMMIRWIVIYGIGESRVEALGLSAMTESTSGNFEIESTLTKESDAHLCDRTRKGWLGGSVQPLRPSCLEGPKRLVTARPKQSHTRCGRYSTPPR